VSSRPLHTAVIITALDVETRAVLRHFASHTVETADGTGFFRGQLQVAVVEAGPGNAAAAAIVVRAPRCPQCGVRQMRVLFQPPPYVALRQNVNERQRSNLYRLSADRA
jgi:hypothetical protein